VRALIVTLVAPLSISHPTQKKLDRWIPGLIAEIGPNEISTPRHAREKQTLLALQLCHGYPRHLTEQEQTIRDALHRGLVFAAGNWANDADGASLAMFSNNYVVFGLSFEQLTHQIINYCLGLGEIRSLSNTLVESQAGRRQRRRRLALSTGQTAAEEILAETKVQLSLKTLSQRDLGALAADVLVMFVCVGLVVDFALVRTRSRDTLKRFSIAGPSKSDGSCTSLTRT
jgi:hypothetical protein